MNKKPSYQAPSIHILKMDSEGVIAASTQDFGAGKRYDLGQPTPQSLTRGLFRFAKNLLPLVAAALMLPACGSEEEPQLTPEAGKTRITVTAGIDEVATRTTYTPGTNDGNTADLMTVVWSSGTTETLNVVNYVDDKAQATISTITGTGTGTKSMSFSGETTASTGGALAGMYNYYYGPTGTFFPGLGIPPLIEIDLSGQQYNVEQSPIVSLKNYDVMYTTSATAGSNITLVHACALIRFNLRLNTAGKAITKITMSADNAGVFIRSLVYLEYKSDGTVIQYAGRYSGTDNVLTLNIQNDDKSTNLSEDRDLVAYMMQPVGDDGLDISGRLIKVSAIDEDGKVYSRLLDLTDKAAGTEVLEAGKCYTFFSSTTTALAEDNFAGSNIYWDGSKLTFVKEPYDMSKVMNQGLFFKWGSLVGISPLGAWNTDTSAGTPWYDTTAHNGGAWSSISPATWASGQDLTNAQDICYQLSGGTYRMPARYEIPTSGTPINSSATFTANAVGTAQIAKGYILNGNLYFPTAGFRGYADGGVSSDSYYWTKTVSATSDKGISLYNNTYPFGGSYIHTAMPIRCIKNPDYVAPIE
jgi:hypothetical protein